MDSIYILIAGVGGQGTLLTSRILGAVALKVGYDVKVSEVHGMAQRGGSVVTHVKFASKVHSPLIEKGEADMLLAFEELEGLRWYEYLKLQGSIIVNSQKINPMPVITRQAEYPLGIIEAIATHTSQLTVVDALTIARECGNAKAVNTVLLGVLAHTTKIAKEIWLEAIREEIPAKFIEINLKAFEAGYAVERG